MVSRRALAPVAACGEATKPGLAPNGSLNQRALTLRVGLNQQARERGTDHPSLTLRVGMETTALHASGCEVSSCLSL
jgi:hypothetical protein